MSERSRRSDRVVGGRRPFTRMRGAGAERGLVAPPGRYWPGERERTADGPALGASDLGVARTPRPLQDDLSLGRRAGGVRGGGRRLARAHGARSPRGSPPGRGRRGGDHSSRPPRRADDGPGPDPYPSCPLKPGAGSGPRRAEVTEGDSSPPWRRGVGASGRRPGRAGRAVSAADGDEPFRTAEQAGPGSGPGPFPGRATDRGRAAGPHPRPAGPVFRVRRCVRRGLRLRDPSQRPTSRALGGLVTERARPSASQAECR